MNTATPSKKELFALDESSEDEPMHDDFGNLDELDSEVEDIEDKESVSSKDEKEVYTNVDDDANAKSADLNYIDQRIREWLSMLQNFKDLGPSGLTRKVCVNNLLKDICTRYSYNEFLALKLLDLFPKEVWIHPP